MNKSWWYVGNCDYTTDNDDNYSFKYGNFIIKYHKSGRFNNDCIFNDYGDCFVLLDGVVFNKKQLIQQDETWIKAIHRLSREKTFPEMLRGSFSGVIIHQNGIVDAFTGHCGEKPVFYCNQDAFFAVSTDLHIFRCIEKEGHVNLSANVDALKYLLSYGFMIDNVTCYKEVYRLMAAQRVLYKGLALSTNYYHEYNNTEAISISDEEAMSRIDALFRKALKLEFDKDLEYGYKHLVDISGGLDSRIVNYVANDMGYKDILNISFSQIGSNEYKAALKMTHHLNHEVLFYSLDTPSFIFDIDKLINMNNGLCVYFTTTGVSKILSHIDFSLYGIEHGGLQGDIREGSFPGGHYTAHVPANVANGMQFSDSNKIEWDIDHISNKYDNQEMFDIYTRGFLGGLSSIMIRNYFAEYFAPFMDPDFYDFYLSMPLDQRVGRQIFKKWIAKYYPQAFIVEDDRTYCRMDAPALIKTLFKYKTKVIGKIDRIGMKYDLFYRQNSMNPLDYWYKTKPEIRIFIEEYYNTNKLLLDEYPEIKEKVNKMMETDVLKERLMAISAISVIKNYLYK